MTAHPLRQHAARALPRLAAALGFSIPLSVVLDNVLLALALAAWLIAGGFGEQWQRLRRNPAILACIALFLLYTAGTAWSMGGTDVRAYWTKMLDLALVPVFAAAFLDPRARRLGLTAFAAALVVTLGLSFALWLGILPEGSWVAGTAANPAVFKLHITHGLFMAFAAYLFARQAMLHGDGRVRGVAWALAALATFNVVFMVQGRSGYLVLAALLALLLHERLRWRGLLLAAAAGAVLFGGAYATSDGFRGRLDTVVQEYRDWTPGQPTVTSTGSRLEFWRNTAAIVAEHPLAGVGTGGFPAAYQARVRDTGTEPVRNPHNQYLLTAAELGAPGLIALLALFALQWRSVPKLAGPLEQGLARALIVTFAVGCLFNSLLLDHAEGLFFAWMTGMLYADLRAGAPA